MSVRDALQTKQSRNYGATDDTRERQPISSKSNDITVEPTTVDKAAAKTKEIGGGIIDFLKNLNKSKKSDKKDA